MKNSEWIRAFLAISEAFLCCAAGAHDDARMREPQPMHDVASIVTGIGADAAREAARRETAPEWDRAIAR